MKPVIIALDFESLKETEEFLDLFQGQSLFVKVGMELFYQTGPSILELIHQKGHQIFLDLKLHDIPNTVERSMKIISNFPVAMVTTHAAGGVEMMRRAKEALGKDKMLLAVTQLTSTSESQMNSEQGIEGTLESSVIRYSQAAFDAGCDAVVCSPLEVELIKEHVPNLKCVTPGIRLASNVQDDQKRITNPSQAKSFGSDYIVVGRPITRAADPVLAYQEIIAAWEA